MSNQNKFLNNAAVSLPEDYKIYIEALEEQFKENDVKNIGIIAPLSGGKSSIIKSYIDTYCTDKNHKYIDVSLANFMEENEDSNNGSDGNVPVPDEKSIKMAEKSILEQILYKVNKKNVPQSKIDRIESKTIKISLSIIGLAISFTLLLIAFLVFGGSKLFGAEWSFYFYFFFGIASLVASLFFVASFAKIKKVAIKNIEVDFDSLENGSVLNLFIDELIYFFKKTKIKIVIFEDIDRFACVRLFSKLREINQIINNDDKKKKVTFIYAIRDGLFNNDEERSKFFEFIISPVPFLTNQNIGEHLLELLSIVGENDLSSQFLNEVAIYIQNKRIVNNIINDYLVYKDVLKIEKRNEKEKLFAMMVFKNIHTKEYANFISGHGKVFEAITTGKKNIIDSIIIQNNARLNEIDNDLSVSTSIINGTSSFKNLKERVAGIIALHGTTSTSRPPKDCCDIKTLTSFEGVKEMFLTRQYTIPYSSNIIVYMIMSASEVSTFIGNDLCTLEKQIAGSVINPLKKEKEIIIDENNAIRNKPIKELLQDEQKNELELSEYIFILFCLREGYIDETYYKYTGAGNSSKCSNFVNNVILGINNDEYAVFDKEESKVQVIQKLNVERFKSKQILNHSIIEVLFEVEEISLIRKRNAFIEFISQGKEETNNFLAHHYYYKKDSFFKMVDVLKKHYNNFVVDVFSSPFLDNNDKDKIVASLIESGDDYVDAYNVNGFLHDYIKNHQKPFRSLLTNNKSTKDKFVKYLIANNILLNHLDYNEDYYSHRKDAFHEVIDNGMFALNDENVRMLFDYYLKADYISVSGILKSDNQILKELFENNIDLFVSLVVKVSNDGVCDNQKTIEYILNNDDISDETKNLYIDSLSNLVENISTFKSNTVLKIISSLKMKPIWSNVNLAFSVVTKENYAIISSYIDNYIDVFEGQISESEFAYKLLNDSPIKDGVFYNKLFKYFDDITLLISKIKDNYVKKLVIDHGLAQLSNEDLKNNIANKDIVIAIIKNQPELLEALLTFNVGSDILVAILENEEIDQNTKVYILEKKYNTLLASTYESYYLLYINICISDLSRAYDSSFIVALYDKVADVQKAVLNKIVIRSLTGNDYIQFMKKNQNELLLALTKEEGFIYVENKMMENEFFIGLKDKGYIFIIKTTKNTIKINNAKLIEAIK